MVRMSPKNEEIYFEEDWNFFMKKKLKILGLGLVLLIIPPIALYYMFFYLIYWSSLFQNETGQLLIFLVLAPIFGFYFISKAIIIPRIRIYEDRVPNPVMLGRRYIPLKDIKLVAHIYSDTEPNKVELHLTKGSKATLDKQIVLGEFLKDDIAKMMSAFRKRGVKAEVR